MRNTILFIILALSVQFKTSAQSNLYSLEIQIIGLKSNNGTVLFQLSNNENELISKKSLKIINKQCVFIINNLKSGKYSIIYFHDENENEKLDTNWLGIPREGYGFSNNASSKFGPPPIKDRLFDINKNIKIILTINY